MVERLKRYPSRRKKGVRIVSLRRALLVVSMERRIRFSSSVAQGNVGLICCTTKHHIEFYQGSLGKKHPSTEHESHFTHEVLSSREKMATMNIYHSNLPTTCWGHVIVVVHFIHIMGKYTKYHNDMNVRKLREKQNMCYVDNIRFKPCTSALTNTKLTIVHEVYS